MGMPKDLDEHCDSIDAALFTGDAFHDEAAREELWAYIGRWTRELEAISDDRPLPTILDPRNPTHVERLRRELMKNVNRFNQDD